MARIYISSTYSDLKVYREKVYHKLRELQHDVVAMEDYIATDERPLDKCLTDVATCDVYIGLFAWRYGYIPPKDNDEQKSITELEYRKAINTNKPRLIFLLQKQVPWLPDAMDQSTDAGDKGKRIVELRQELEQETIVSFFQNPDHLAGQVASAVSLWEKKQSQQDVLRPILEKFRTMRNVVSEDSALFNEEDIYPDHCNYVMNDVRTINEPVQRLLIAVTGLPPEIGVLRFELSKILYHIEALVNGLIPLVTTFRSICRTPSKQTITKRNELHLKLDELVQNLDISIGALEALFNRFPSQSEYVKTTVNTVDIDDHKPRTTSLPSSTTSTPAALSHEGINTDPERLMRIRNSMHDKYDLVKFQLLCADMGIQYDDLRGEGLELKMHYFIDWCRRNNKVDKLISRMQDEFQGLNGKL